MYNCYNILLQSYGLQSNVEGFCRQVFCKKTMCLVLGVRGGGGIGSHGRIQTVIFQIVLHVAMHVSIM